VPAIVESLAELQGIRDAWSRAGETVALVPTMGSLHEGHRALVEEAARQADRVVVSIFVNPLQFGHGEDYDEYPRGLLADEAFLARGPVDLIFAPSVQVMYPEGLGSAPTQSAGAVGQLYEGASRPGHFDGVLTVVKRLLDYVTPEVAVFGRKDAQQVFLIKQMVAMLGLPVLLYEVDTVRDQDGLALSSRHAFLAPGERITALHIPRALEAAGGSRSAGEAQRVVAESLDQAEGVAVDYVDVVDPNTFQPVPGGMCQGEALMIVAAVVGSVRLIDTKLLRFGQ
jgi:pantoate--beta-alanine ligase